MPDDMMALAEGEALTADEVAAMLQASKNTVYNLVKRDELASYHVGRKMRFTRADVQNYVARSRRQKAWGQHGAPANLAVPDLGQAGEAAALAAAQPSAAAHSAAATTASATPALAGATASQRAASAHAEAAGSYVLAGNNIVGDMLANYLGMVDVPIKRVYEGSYRALSELYFGRVQAAFTHIYEWRRGPVQRDVGAEAGAGNAVAGGAFGASPPGAGGAERQPEKPALVGRPAGPGRDAGEPRARMRLAHLA